MDTVIERDSGSSSVALILGILATAVLVGAGLYFFRVYPFVPAPASDTTKIDIQLTNPPSSASDQN